MSLWGTFFSGLGLKGLGFRVQRCRGLRVEGLGFS